MPFGPTWKTFRNEKFHLVVTHANTFCIHRSSALPLKSNENDWDADETSSCLTNDSWCTMSEAFAIKYAELCRLEESWKRCTFRKMPKKIPLNAEDALKQFVFMLKGLSSEWRWEGLQWMRPREKEQKENLSMNSLSQYRVQQNEINRELCQQSLFNKCSLHSIIHH